MKVALIAKEKTIGIDLNKNVYITYLIKFKESEPKWTSLHIIIGKDGYVYNEDGVGKYKPIEKWMFNLVKKSLAVPNVKQLFEYQLYNVDYEVGDRSYYKLVGEYSYQPGDQYRSSENRPYSDRYEPIKDWEKLENLIRDKGTRATAYEKFLKRQVVFDSEITLEMDDSKNLAESSGLEKIAAQSGPTHTQDVLLPKNELMKKAVLAKETSCGEGYIRYLIKFEQSETEWQELRIAYDEQSAEYTYTLGGVSRKLEKTPTCVWINGLLEASVHAASSGILKEYQLAHQDNVFGRTVYWYTFTKNTKERLQEEMVSASLFPVFDDNCVLNEIGYEFHGEECFFCRQMPGMEQEEKVKIILPTDSSIDVEELKSISSPSEQNDSSVLQPNSEKLLEAIVLSSDDSTENNTEKNVPPSTLKLPIPAQFDNNSYRKQSSPTSNPSSCASNSNNSSFLLKALLGFTLAGGVLAVVGVVLSQFWLVAGVGLAVGPVLAGAGAWGFFSRKQVETHYQNNQMPVAAPTS